MKALILSCNTGEGHNSSAKAILNELQVQGYECEMRDTLSLVSETTSKNVSAIYVYSTKSSLFGKAYKLGEKISDINLTSSPINLANRVYTKPLLKLIEDNGFDIVVCTHLFPAEALTHLKSKGVLAVSTLFVMTDYTCIPFLPETNLDKYVIPHEHLIEEYVEKGLDRNKLYPLGIPVREDLFANRIPREEARRQIEELTGWNSCDEGSRWFLIMGGSMGHGNMHTLIEELLKDCAPQDRIICVCGRNEEQKQQLDSEFGNDYCVKSLGYTDKVSLLMDASDVLFSKPGGITSTEAIVKNIPLIHSEPIKGVEDQNAIFFHYHGMSYRSLDPVHQAKVAVRLCDDKEYRQRMLDAQKLNRCPDTCKRIVELMKEMVNEKMQTE